MEELYRYPFEVRPLDPEEGGGYLVTFPDIPGCMSDGETPEEAIRNGLDALRATLEALEEWGRPIPEPGSAAKASGRMALRLPKSLHAKLIARARQDGVSINTEAVTLIAEGLGRRAARDGDEPPAGPAA